MDLNKCISCKSKDPLVGLCATCYAWMSGRESVKIIDQMDFKEVLDEINEKLSKLLRAEGFE